MQRRHCSLRGCTEKRWQDIITATSRYGCHAFEPRSSTLENIRSTPASEPILTMTSPPVSMAGQSRANYSARFSDRVPSWISGTFSPRMPCCSTRFWPSLDISGQQTSCVHLGSTKSRDVREPLVREKIDEEEPGHDNNHGGHEKVRGDVVVLAGVLLAHLFTWGRQRGASPIPLHVPPC